MRMYCMSASFQRIHSGVRVNRGLECSVRGGKCWAGMAEIKESTSWTGRSLPVLEKTGCIYLDYNATTPIYPEVAKAMEPFLYENFGNPSSKHVYGIKCHAAVEGARQQVADLVHCSPEEVYYTSCGTESNNWAIWGVVAAARKNRGISVPHVVTSAVEHPAVLKYLAALKDQGLLTYTTVPVGANGVVVPSEIVSAIIPETTVLVSIMHSNNEVGAIQPIKEISAKLKGAGNILFHCDAAQSLGKVPVNVDDLGVDMLSIVGHKFGAPKGVAGLYVRSGIELEPLLQGGCQERGFRSGTESVLLVVGLGMACEIARKEASEIYSNMINTRNRLWDLLVSSLGPENVQQNGPQKDSDRLPNTLNLSIRGLDSRQLLAETADTLAASAGSACDSGGVSVSSVLRAMQVPLEAAKGTLRLSTGRHTTINDVEKAAELIVQKVKA